MKSNKLSTFEKIGFGAGDMAVNVVISSMMLIIAFFYTDIYGLKPADIALPCSPRPKTCCRMISG